jgi:hypothetical protein
MPNSLISSSSELWTFSHDRAFSSFFVNHPYLLTFGEEFDHGDIWRLCPTGMPEHTATLSEMIPVPKLDQGVIISLALDLIIIPSTTSATLNIFSLVDGTLLDYVTLQGNFLPWPARHMHGQVLLGRVECEVIPSSQDENQEEIHMTSRITSCKWLDDEKTFRVDEVQLSNAQHNHSHSSLVPLLLTETGDILGASSGAYSETMDVLRWRGPSFMPTQEPEAAVALSVCFPEADLKGPESTAQMGEDKLLLCTHEHILDTAISARTSQMVVYSLNTRTLAIHWKAEPIWGTTCRLFFSPAINAVVGIGENNEVISQNTRWHKVTWIALLDKDTGVCLRREIIDHHEVGVPVIQCTVSQGAEKPSLVVVFEDADYIIISLRDFKERGLPRNSDDGSLLVTKIVQSPAKAHHAVVADGVLLVALDDAITTGKGSSRMLGVNF